MTSTPRFLCPNHGFNKMGLMQLVHVDFERAGRSVNPCQQIHQSVFRADDGRDGACTAQRVLVTERASTKAAPSVMPIGHRVGIR